MAAGAKKGVSGKRFFLANCAPAKWWKGFFGKNSLVAAVYLLLQAVIWIKCWVFFALYGAGRVMAANSFLFPQDAVVFNYYFHEAMHVAIGILALLFGKNLKKIEWLRLIAIIFGAVAVHNVAYWFTWSHPNILYSVYDFCYDSTLLLVVVLVGYFLGKIFSRRAAQ